MVSSELMVPPLDIENLDAMTKERKYCMLGVIAFKLGEGGIDIVSGYALARWLSALSG